MAGTFDCAAGDKKFRNLANFRQICVKNGDEDHSRSMGLLYRSSRPDFLTDTEVDELKRLGIRSVVDFRSPKEYARASGQKRLDKICALYAVEIPDRKNYRPQEKVRHKLILSKGHSESKKSDRDLDKQREIKCERNGMGDVKPNSFTDKIIHGNKNIENFDDHNDCHSKLYPSTEPDCNKEINTQAHDDIDYDSGSAPVVKHYLINFFTTSFIWTVFQRVPWYIRLYALLWLVVDLIFRTGFLYFVQIFAKYVLNPNGLLAQYKDIVDLSQRSICAALKLLTDTENIPALINCAHGKDRTGIVTALVMHCLGKSNEEIAEEYSKSEEGLRPVKDRLYSEIVGHYHFSEQFMTAQPSTMLQLLEYISEKYGSVSNYLEYIGFSRKEQEQLKRNLLCTEL